MTKSSSTSKSNKPTTNATTGATKGHAKPLSKKQDRPSTPSTTTPTTSGSVSSRGTPSIPQQIDLTNERTETIPSTSTSPVRIPSIQHTKDLPKKIARVVEELETNRQFRARLDRKIAELQNLKDRSSIVVEASILKHIYAQAHLRLLAGEETLQHQNMSILFWFVGISYIFIHFIDRL